MIQNIIISLHAPKMTLAVQNSHGIIPQYFRKNKFLDENRILILECYREIGSSEYNAYITNFLLAQTVEKFLHPLQYKKQA